MPTFPLRDFDRYFHSTRLIVSDLNFHSGRHLFQAPLTHQFTGWPRRTGGRQICTAWMPGSGSATPSPPPWARTGSAEIPAAWRGSAESPGHREPLQELRGHEAAGHRHRLFRPHPAAVHPVHAVQRLDPGPLPGRPPGAGPERPPAVHASVRAQGPLEMQPVRPPFVGKGSEPMPRQGPARRTWLALPGFAGLHWFRPGSSGRNSCGRLPEGLPPR